MGGARQKKTRRRRAIGGSQPGFLLKFAQDALRDVDAAICLDVPLVDEPARQVGEPGVDPPRPLATENDGAVGGGDQRRAEAVDRFRVRVSEASPVKKRLEFSWKQPGAQHTVRNREATRQVDDAIEVAGIGGERRLPAAIDRVAFAKCEAPCPVFDSKVGFGDGDDAEVGKIIGHQRAPLWRARGAPSFGRRDATGADPPSAAPNAPITDIERQSDRRVGEKSSLPDLAPTSVIRPTRSGSYLCVDVVAGGRQSRLSQRISPKSWVGAALRLGLRRPGVHT